MRPKHNATRYILIALNLGGLEALECLENIHQK